jgi:hypothetical protein
MGRVLSTLYNIYEIVKLRDVKTIRLTVHKLHPSFRSFWSRKALVWAHVTMTLEFVMRQSQGLRGYGLECRCLLMVSVSLIANR